MRVPNVREIGSIVGYGRLNPYVDPVFDTGCTPGCTVTTCSCTQDLLHWSATTVPDAKNHAWAVSFSAGDVALWDKTDVAVVRAVRGGP